MVCQNLSRLFRVRPLWLYQAVPCETFYSMIVILFREMAFIAIKRVADLPDGCVRRDCIEQCFLYCSDRKLIDASMFEYGDLLQTELLFKKLQPEKVLFVLFLVYTFHMCIKCRIVK